MKEKETLEKHIIYAVNLQYFLNNSRWARAHTHMVTQNTQSTDYLCVRFSTIFTRQAVVIKADES